MNPPPPPHYRFKMGFDTILWQYDRLLVVHRIDSDGNGIGKSCFAWLTMTFIHPSCHYFRATFFEQPFFFYVNLIEFYQTKSALSISKSHVVCRARRFSTFDSLVLYQSHAHQHKSTFSCGCIIIELEHTLYLVWMMRKTDPKNYKWFWQITNYVPLKPIDGLHSEMFSKQFWWAPFYTWMDAWSAYGGADCGRRRFVCAKSMWLLPFYYFDEGTFSKALVWRCKLMNWVHILWKLSFPSARDHFALMQNMACHFGEVELTGKCRPKPVFILNNLQVKLRAPN